MQKPYYIIVIIFLFITLGGFDGLCIQPTDTNEISPTPQKIESIKNIPSMPNLRHFEFDRSLRLVYSLWIAIIYFILSMLIILPFILLNRNKIEKKAKTDQFLKEKYQDFLISFLYNVEDKKNEIKRKIKEISRNNYNKQFLINEIIDLSINLKGETTEQLRALYMELGLDSYTFEKVKSRKWHLKIKAYRELAFMGLRQSNKEIIKSIESKNDILRMEAQIAMIRLNEGDPFRFLDYLQKPFTLWEQMNTYELMMVHNLPVPDFTRWIHSENKTIAIFALNMIRVFKQKEAYSKIVEMLDHEDIQIREAVIETIGSFKLHEALDPLKDHFKTEVYENKMNILKALQKSYDESNIPFLKNVLETEHDVFLQIEAAKGISAIGQKGEEELENLIKSEDYRNYLIILRHVLDKRI